MEGTFKRKMSSARICQSYDLLHFTHCVGLQPRPPALPTHASRRRGEAGLTGLILIAPGRSLGRRVVRFNSIIKPERREVRDHDGLWVGGGGEEKSSENSPATANNQRIPSFQKNSYKKSRRRTDGEGNLIGRPGVVAIRPHFCLGGEKTWP